MPEDVSILITGAEVLDGRVHDSNSFFLLQELKELGIPARHVLSCGDNEEQIAECLRYLSTSRVVIVSGGLGPTSDDLTREGVARLADVPLVEDERARSALEHFLTLRGRKLDHSNIKQTLIPQGARLIENSCGTAPGFELTFNTTTILVAPGVPHELREMWKRSLGPRVMELIKVAPRQSTYFRIFGLAEAEVGKRVVSADLPPDISVSYRAAFPEIHVGLISSTLPEELKSRVADAIGREFIFSQVPDENLPQVVVNLLAERNLTVAPAESCTGGMVSALITDVPGASKVFLGGVVTYDNALKFMELGVPNETIKQYGAVSFETARAMAEGMRKRSGASVALSITGIAGPSGGSVEKPVGTFFIGIALGNELSAFHCYYPSSRERVRQYASYCALDVLRRKLLGLEVRWPAG